MQKGARRGTGEERKIAPIDVLVICEMSQLSQSMVVFLLQSERLFQFHG